MCARVAYCVDIDKSVIIGNFEKRGWLSVSQVTTMCIALAVCRVLRRKGIVY